ncbi:MAG: ABC transporter substrate-binding protein, partial [Firmicutes bacterium]|nr:ABC transporter substrate-binding protein [Bacillota bacterium]
MLFSAEADLVIASSNTKKHVELKDTLEAAKVPVLYFEINEFSDYLRMLKACTDITGRPDLYEKNGTKIQAQIEKIKASAAEAAKTSGAPKVLYIRAAASGIHAKGSAGTVLGPMLKDLGCINIADGSELLDKLSMEMIIKEDPDMIFIVQQGSDDEGTKKTISETLTSNPAWSGLKAVKEGRVYYLEKSLYHFKPNARWAEAYEKLEKIIYGK